MQNKAATIPPIETCVIYIDGDGWMIDQSDDSQAPELRLLFGTAVLPMPFLRPTPESVVRLALERRNPGIVITRGLDR